jgi:hypothetical protein
MDETDTATIELSKGEAREVIGALAAFDAGKSGREDERILNVENLLQREFGFEESRAGNDRGIVEAFFDVFDDDGRDHEIQLSRREATEVVRALDELDDRRTPEEAETVADVRGRFAETYDLDDRPAGR